MTILYTCFQPQFLSNIAIVFSLVIFAGLTSGLSDLEVLAKSSTPKDKQHADFTSPTLVIGSSKPGLVALAKVAAQNSIAVTRSTAQVAKAYAKGSTKDKAETCIDYCNVAISNLNQSLNALKTYNRGKIGDLKSWGSTTATSVNLCDDEFSQEPAQLKKATKDAFNSIIKYLRIVNQLK